MAKMNKKALTTGIILALSFLVVLFLIFSPIFGNGRNGLTYADDMFNTLSKGSSYFIPDLMKNSDNFKGQTISVKISVGKPEDKAGDAEQRAERIRHVLTVSGATVELQGADLTINADLGNLLAAVLNDSIAMYNNDGAAIKSKYATDDEKQTFRQWYNAFIIMDKTLKKEGKIEQAKIISDVTKKAVETAYNYYKVEPVKVKDKALLMTALLVFYVAYTMWWGFAIYYIFEGIGLSMSKAKH